VESLNPYMGLSRLLSNMFMREVDDAREKVGPGWLDWSPKFMKLFARPLPSAREALQRSR
jgi:hypothetical protein